MNLSDMYELYKLGSKPELTQQQMELIKSIEMPSKQEELYEILMNQREIIEDEF